MNGNIPVLPFGVAGTPGRSLWHGAANNIRHGKLGTRELPMKRRTKILAVIVALVFSCQFPLLAVAEEKSGGSQDRKVRPAAVAGAFYPADKVALEEFVRKSLQEASREQFSLSIKAVLAPHAGYVYCGRTMAAAYKQIEGDAFVYDRVVLIGPSHRVKTKAAAVSSAEAWETPLGLIPVDKEAVRELVESSDRIELNDLAHAMEHSLETQLPYLVVAARGKPFKIVPVVTGSSDPLDQEIVARGLLKMAGDPRTLVVISSDLSHFPSAEVAEVSDRAILRAVASLSPDTLQSENVRLLKAAYPGLSCTMCGIDATLCFLRTRAALGVRAAKIVSYSHSGMAVGDDKRVVGYGAIVFESAPDNPPSRIQQPLALSFSDQARRELLSLARSAVNAAVNGEWVAFTPSNTAELQVKAGCFVTLKTNGKLRGCIGRFQSDQPLWKTAREVAIASATDDPRFADSPIKPQETSELEIEISVLSPMRRVTDPLEEIKLGRDGIVIEDQGRMGTFLPQVAIETGWSLEEFLGHCARDKAGLAWDGWKSPTAQIYAYTATIVREQPERQQ